MKNPFATVHYAGNDFFLAVSPSGHAVPIDTNGQRSAASGPLELLLLSLGGCTGADVISILHKKRERVTDYRVEIRGERREEHPRSYRKIELRHIVRGLWRQGGIGRAGGAAFDRKILQRRGHSAADGGDRVHLGDSGRTTGA